MLNSIIKLLLALAVTTLMTVARLASAGGCGCGGPPPLLPPPLPICPPPLPPPMCPPLPPPCPPMPMPCPPPIICPLPPPPLPCPPMPPPCELPPPCPPIPPPLPCPPPLPPPPPMPCGCPPPLPPPMPAPLPMGPPAVSSYPMAPWNDCCCQCGQQCQFRPYRVRSHGARIFSANAAEFSDDPTCNNQKLKTVIEENISKDASTSKRAIQAAAEARLFTKVNVICAEGDFSYVAYTDTYCQASTGRITCYAFRPLAGEGPTTGTTASAQMETRKRGENLAK